MTISSVPRNPRSVPVKPKVKSIPRARGRPSRLQSAALRDAFLDAALLSFLHNGYMGTSIEGVARASNVAKITIYRQFETKLLLFGEVVRRLLEQNRAAMQTALRSDEADTEKRLLALIEGVYLGACEPCALALQRLAIAEAKRFPEFARMVDSENVSLLEPLIQFLTDANRTGALCVPLPERTATHIAALVLGGTRLLILPPLTVPDERREWAKSVLDLVLPGLRSDQ